MKLQFIKVSPAQNMTIYVMDQVSRGRHIEVANKLLDYGNLYAEQVAFIEKSGEYIRLQMMGGEFCGNATRSLAAIIVDRGLDNIRKEGDDYLVKLETSGLESIVECKVRKTDKKNIYMSQVHMPLALSKNTVKFSLGEREVEIERIDFPGITHFIVDDKKIDDREGLYEIVKSYMDKEDYDAFGIMYYDYTDNFLIPLVYVKATDSLYWEKSCGSGTTALGAALAHKNKKNIDISIPQPGGQLRIKAEINKGKIDKLILDGPVEIVAEGMVYI